MNDEISATALACLQGAESNSLKFPEIVGRLMAAGFESYAIDLRRGLATCFTTADESVEFKAYRPSATVAAAMDVASLKAAILAAQRNVAGYTFLGFCEKAAAAGCASYFVSFPGRRALYIGRTGETHTEHFPK